jgi:hypothetical protein
MRGCAYGEDVDEYTVIAIDIYGTGAARHPGIAGDDGGLLDVCTHAEARGPSESHRGEGGEDEESTGEHGYSWGEEIGWDRVNRDERARRDEEKRLEMLLMSFMG